MGETRIDRTEASIRARLHRRCQIGVVALVAVPMVASAQAASARTLRVVTSGDGVVTTADRRVNCGADCKARFKSRAVVGLKASPGDDSVFRRWSGGCVGTAPRCIIALGRTTNVRATFARVTRTLNVAVGGPGTVVSQPEGLDCGTGATTCAASFEHGTTVRLTASPDDDATFDTWGSTFCSLLAFTTCDVLMRSDVGASAAFRHATPPPSGNRQTLTVNARGAIVVSVPAGINCAGVQTCSASFPTGTRVTLKAGSARWGGACAGSGVECTIVVDRPTSVSASQFIPALIVKFGLSVSVSGPGRVSGGDGQIFCGRGTRNRLDCSGLFRRDTSVTLKAVPLRGARFGRWGSFCRGNKRRCPLTASASKTVTAVFRR